MKRILVIKLGALGDFVHAFHALAAIRWHHRGDHITLLTTPPYRGLGETMPWVDAVRLDDRPPWWNLQALRRTRRALLGFDFIYDLQTSRRSSKYFRLAGRPPWSGIARGSSHPHSNPERDRMHTLDRQREQLQLTGIIAFPTPSLDWLVQQSAAPAFARPNAVVIPGAGGLGDRKRWPVRHYARVASELAGRGVLPLIVGGAAEAPLGKAIVQACPTAVDLTGRTTIADIAALAARADLVIGNDTGPLHLAAKTGTRTIVLLSSATVPAEAAPRGPSGEWATVVQEPELADLTVERVMAAIDQGSNSR